MICNVPGCFRFFRVSSSSVRWSLNRFSAVDRRVLIYLVHRAAQDVASKGLGLLYDLGDSTTKAELVQVLVSTFSEGSRSQTHKYTTSSEDEVQFGSMGADNRNGQGFSTYKELCSIASDLNQPDLIYKFMQLANHNTMWNSRKGAAFGFSSIAARAQQELQPHLPALVPRLYRYQFDPSPSVRSAMDNIFKILCPEVHKVTDKYCDTAHKVTNGGA